MNRSLFAMMAALVVLSPRLGAGELERRTFTVYVDNKAHGTSVMEIQTRPDGATTLTAAANIEVKILVRYTFTFQGNEVWKENKLHQMTTTTNDNGKKLSVALERNKDGYTMNATGKEMAVRGDLWPTTYWKLPPENMRKELNLVDSDTGKVIAVKMEKLGNEKITAVGQPVNSVHYRLTGGLQVDLWYDGNDRLLRQELIEQGHKTVLELSRLQRE